MECLYLAMEGLEMLVLTRKTNDTIVIDGRIRIEVLQVRKGGIRIGISAPDDVRIRRGELAPLDLDPADLEPAELELDQGIPTPARWGSHTISTAELESAIGCDGSQWIEQNPTPK